MSLFAGRTRLLAILASLAAAVSLAGASQASASSKGQLDPSFGSHGFASASSDTRLFGTAVQPDGKIVAVGAIGFNANNVRLLVVRFTAAGSPDPSFSGGKVIGPGSVIGRAVVIQPDGKIVVAGESTDATGASMNGIVVERFTSSGAPDGSFGSGGIARALSGDPAASGDAVVRQPDGKIVVGGSGTISSGADQGYQGAALVRLNSNGALDGGFGPGGVEVADLGRYSVASGIALQPDGKIVVGGSARDPSLQVTNLMAARFNSNGSRDGSFAGGGFVQQYAGPGGAYSAANAVALQPDGKVVLAGSALSNTGITALFVRLTPSGAPDGSFGSGGVERLPASDMAGPPPQGSQYIPYAADGLVVSGGEILATGWFLHSGYLKELAVWGLTGSGTPDNGFGTGGRTLITASKTTGIQGNAIALEPDGRLAVAGELIVPPFSPTPGSGFVAVLFGSAAPPPPPPLKTTLKVPGRAKITSVIKSGLRVTVGCNQACRASLTLTVSFRDAKRLRLKTRGRRSVTIGTASTSIAATGAKVIVLRLSRAASKGLRSVTRLTTTFKVSYTAIATRRSSSSSRTIVLVR